MAKCLSILLLLAISGPEVLGTLGTLLPLSSSLSFPPLPNLPNLSFIPAKRAWRQGQIAVADAAAAGLPSLQTYLSETMARINPAIEELELGSMVPSMPFSDKDVNNVKFFLFTRPASGSGSDPTGDNKSSGDSVESSGDESSGEGGGSGSGGGPEELLVNDISSIKSSSFNPNRPLKILIHGWSMSMNSKDFPGPVKNAYLDYFGEGGVNLVVVEWSSLSREFLYFNSVMYAEKVGRRVGEFLVFLHLAGFIPKGFSHVHLIGFSLGAHVAAIAGHFVLSSTNQELSVGRITGLDPAGPGFPATTPISQRLDSGDADFVDVIHTNMGTLIKGEFGSPLSAGHADFYPNGGHRQPGCELSLLREYSVPRRSGCHHMKSIDYWVDSIRAPRLGCKCRDWTTFKKGGCNCSIKENRAAMGEHCHPGARGKYYLHAH